MQFLAPGGNAEVWKAQDANGNEVALKLLKARNPESDRYKRFRSEVELLKQLQGRRGILPLLDSDIPDRPSSKSPAWYSMPVAESVVDVFSRQRTLEDVVGAVLEFARLLAELADEKIFHRDLKPNNLFYWDGNWCLGDFGLASYPGKEVLTEEGANFGASFFKPLELSEDAANANPAAVDVFSLAKTLYVLARGDTWPPPGPQRADDKSVALSTYLSDPRTHQLDRLIESCTRSDPTIRPTMRAMVKELELWQTPVMSKAPEPQDFSDIAHQLTLLLEPLRHAQEVQKSISQDMYAVDRSIREHLVRFGKEIAQNRAFRVLDPSSNNQEIPRLLAKGQTAIGHMTATCAVIFPEGLTDFISLHSGYVIDVAEDRTVVLNVGHVLRKADRHEAGKIIWVESATFPMGSAQQEHETIRLFEGLRNSVRQGLQALLEAVEEWEWQRANR